MTSLCVCMYTARNKALGRVYTFHKIEIGLLIDWLAYVLDPFGLLLHDVLDLDMDILYAKERGVDMYVSEIIYSVLQAAPTWARSSGCRSRVK